MKLILADHPDIPQAQLEEASRVVTFNKEAYSKVDTKNVAMDSDYQPDEIATDEEFDTLREWLTGQFFYAGVDIGPLVQNTFIDLFGHELLRQTKTIKKILQTEQPSEVKVFSDPKPVYHWSPLGSGQIIPGIPEAVATTENIQLRCFSKPITKRRIKNKVFRLVGPSVLRPLDWGSEMISRTRGDEPPHDSDIILFVFTKNNINVVEPVVEALDDGVNLTVVTHSHGFLNTGGEISAVLSNLDVPVVPLEQYASLASYKDEVNTVTQLGKAHNSAQPFSNHREHKLCGVDLTSALQSRGWLYSILQYPRVVRYVNMIQNMFRTEQPAAVLLKNDGPLPTRAVATVAADEGTPTLLIQHGVDLPSRRYVPVSDQIAVWGERWQKVMQAKGVGPDRTEITGAPQFDHLAHYSAKDQSQVREQLSVSVDSQAFTVLLASQPFDDTIRSDLIQTAIGAVSKLPDVELILRPHPREDTELHRNAATDMSNVQVSENDDIHDLLFASDVVLALRSTVVLEASLLSRPVIILNVSSEKPPISEFSEQNGFTEVTNQIEAHQCIEEMRNDPNCITRYVEKQPGFGREYALNEDGGAASRVARLVETLVPKSK
ncbi:CDP-glycerol glycerophosphotransferase family protein [Halorubrum distributum]|uniref:CDP-glycerol glycerophosphotransferase family protein n=1 Tax=Halorubrum distributum TaxID=29283 RepID=UPI0009B5B5D5|nr:CDP-glycerol glycerophosphotransferase family protein [Halorubrum arcis]